MSSSSHPYLVLGTGLLGMQLEKPDELEAVLKALEENAIGQIETAARYPPTNAGLAEKMLGDAKAVDTGFQVDTKILVAGGDGSGELSTASITESVQKSFERLQVKSVNTLYCHRFDPATPLAETAKTMHDLYQQGAFKRWGICRFEPEQLKELLDVCERHNYTKPQVYQGEYNVITRAAEDRVMPIIRAHNMCYYAHRPFATGFLTGKFTQGNIQGTRFADDFPINFVFRKEYGSQQLHDAIQKFQSVLQPHGISCIEAALRWISFHSALKAGDGIVFGCSSVQQIVDNAQSVRKGALPDDVARSVNDLWTEFAKQGRVSLL